MLRKSPSHKGDEDVWATGYKGDMFEVETTEVADTAEWWIRLGEKEWTILSKVYKLLKKKLLAKFNLGLVVKIDYLIKIHYWEIKNMQLILND